MTATSLKADIQAQHQEKDHLILKQSIRPSHTNKESSQLYKSEICSKRGTFALLLSGKENAQKDIRMCVSFLLQHASSTEGGECELTTFACLYHYKC